MKQIDVEWATRVRMVELAGGDLRQISQCSMTDDCKLLQCVPEYDDHLEHNKAAVVIQRVSRGGRGRRRAIARKNELELRRKVAAKNAFQLNVLNKVENNATVHKQDENRNQARHMLAVADHDSEQFRWYAKLQVALQFIEQQKEALAFMIAGGGIKDPHFSLEDSTFEPSCRSLQELREKQRRHTQIERIKDPMLVKLAEKHKLPAYALDTIDDLGEHIFSDMTVFARLGNIQEETEEYFGTLASINKDLDVCRKDEAHWDDPSVRARWTAQEINRNKKRIKDDRYRLEEELRGRNLLRRKSKVRRASLSRVEGLNEFVVETRGRQKLRSVARRRRSLNLNEARVRKDVEEEDLEWKEVLKENRERVKQSLNACALLR